MDPATDALRRIIEEVVDSRLATWQSAKPVEPAPVPEPKPATTGWITNRAPEESDGDCDGEVWIPSRIHPRVSLFIHWSHVHIGTPWVPGDATPAAPWDPTTLDRKGWIRSRLPTKGDTKVTTDWKFERVLIPAWDGQYEYCRKAFIDYRLVTPGQPWAPWGSNPGSYEP